MQVFIEPSALNTMVKHLESTYPSEGCGFLFGYETSKYRKISLARPVNNSKQGDQSRRYVIDPRDYLAAEKYAMVHQIGLVGIYHSHPDYPAGPSTYDLEQAVPYFSYVILSILKGVQGDITSWQLNESGRLIAEDLIINHEKPIKS